MKYCSRCGKELIDEAVVCVNCGCSVEIVRPVLESNNLETKFCVHCGKKILKEAVICVGCGCNVQELNPTNKKKTNVKTGGYAETAIVFFYISTVFMGLSIIPLLWCIPMTREYVKKVRNGEKVSVEFKICLLLFVNIIGGILALMDDSNK